MTAKVLLAVIRAYQLALSPFLGGSCRFLPTCSVYAREAIERHGAWRGSWLALRRLASCHPLGRSGFDPVPTSAFRAAVGKPAPRTSDLGRRASDVGLRTSDVGPRISDLTPRPPRLAPRASRLAR